MSRPKSRRRIILPCSTPLPNYFLDEIMHRVPTAYFIVLLAIWRKTIGWDKERDWISHSQFRRLTGFSKPTVIAAVRFWCDVGLVRRVRAGFRGTNAFEVVLDAPLSEVLGRIDRLVKKLNRSKRLHLTGKAECTSLVQPVDTQKATKEKQRRESNASPLPGEKPKPPKTRAQLAIRSRELQGFISSLELHLKNPFLQPAERARITAGVAEYRAELAQVEAALAAMPPA